MRHEGAASRGSGIRVEDVPYAAVHALRLAWEREDFPDQEPGRYLAQSGEVARRRRARVLAVCKEGAPVAFAQLERDGEAAEITKVYVHRRFRGCGLGTALTQKAIEAAGEVRDLWIAADDERRAKEIYARLGFRAACTRMHFLRLP
jgi:GNAT superfamily N-acetyltransferase